MCGPFALALGSAAPSWQANVLRQTLYTAGRAFTYAFLGALAGFIGWRITKSLPAIINVPAVLAIIAGLFLVYQGLETLGLFRKRVAGAPTGCLAGSFFAPLLTGKRLLDAFLAGVFTGLLPCGLLYGMLALAASRRDFGWGMIGMVVFALGTMPMMFAVGMGGQLLSLTARKRMFQIAACCLVITGVLSLARGIGFLQITAAEPAGCPFCQ
jgi:sulfite exporter TauE/SafE